MKFDLRAARSLLLGVGVAARLFAQAPPATAQSTPDTLVFQDGEKLIGQLISATDTVVVFKSAIGFEVAVPWAKIQELRSDKKFAAIHKSVILHDPEEVRKVPVGAVDMKDQKLEVAAGPESKSIPVKELSNVVGQKAFEAAMHRTNIFGGWKGGVNFGLSLTDATITTRTFNGAVDLARQDTSEGWLPVRNRSSFGVNFFNSLTSQVGVYNTKTTIIHSDFVHDMYFNPRVFGFLGATFDHNYNQRLQLLQGYGGGIGFVAIKNDVSELDVRAGIGYVKQVYDGYPELNKNLVGSRFNENYTRRFSHGITLFEQAGIRPAWNDMKSYFAGFVLGVNVPVYKRFSVNLNSFDSYNNNPPPYRKKNTLQVTVGIHYELFK
jgi:hypothetical protein